MIKCFLVSEEEPSGQWIASKELEVVKDAGSCDVIVIKTQRWNRATAAKYTHLLNPGSKPAIIFCEHAEEPFTRDSTANISGVLSTSVTAEQLVAAVRAAAAGLHVQHRSVSARLDEPHESLLTPRELEILRLIADGEGNKSIAYLLNISQHTVKFHISSIFEKLHVFSRTEAVKAGITRGFISI